MPTKIYVALVELHTAHDNSVPVNDTVTLDEKAAQPLLDCNAVREQTEEEAAAAAAAAESAAAANDKKTGKK